MGNIKIIKGVFDSSLELEHAEVAAGFPNRSGDGSLICSISLDRGWSF